MPHYSAALQCRIKVPHYSAVFYKLHLLEQSVLTDVYIIYMYVYIHNQIKGPDRSARARGVVASIR